MLPKEKSWYKEIWTLDIKNQSWTEDTKRQVDFIINTLGLKGDEKILDLACGFGRHSLELARRGFEVVGVDITKDYVDDANAEAKKQNLNAVFFQKDIREVDFENEFDLVLNMGDGAIGYLENDGENLKIFDVISRALKNSGKHVMDIMSADYADGHFPCKLWDDGEKGLTLSVFEWDKETQIMLYGQNDFAYGDILSKPNFGKADPIRLYHMAEIEEILDNRQMKICKVFGDFNGTIYDENQIQMIVFSEKRVEM